MKKLAILFAAMMLICACGSQRNSAAGSSQSTNTQVSAMSAGQGAGDALHKLYAQYKADGNKYDYKNIQNILNTVSLVGNCATLKDNYKNKSYLSEFGTGMIAGSLGLVTQANQERVTNSLVDMMRNNESVQEGSSQMKSNAAIAAQYAGALSSLLSDFSEAQ